MIIEPMIPQIKKLKNLAENKLSFKMSKLIYQLFLP